MQQRLLQSRSRVARRGKKRPHTKALSVVRTLSGQAVCADPDRTAEHAESLRLPPPPPLSSSASQSSSSSSSVPVGLAAAIGGRKKKQFGPSLDGRCSRGREGGKEAVGWGGHRRHSDPLSLPPPRPPPDRRGPVHRQLEPWVEMVNAGMIVVQRPLSSVFKKWT